MRYGWGKLSPYEECDSWRHPIAYDVENAADFTLSRLDVRSRRWRECLHSSDRLRKAVSIDGFDERPLTARANRHGLNDGYPEFSLEGLPIEPVPSLLGYVAHVESDEHGAAYPFELENQSQVQAQIGRVDYAYEEVRWWLGCVPSENDVAGDGLVQ